MSLPELLEQGLSLVRDRAARQRLTVELEIAPEVGVVWADEVKLKQVVVNLLTNAVKFTPEGGRIDVAARVTGDEVQIYVRDTGVGIADADQERIFEAFQRGDRRVSVEGTGLGLTLSKRFVELHGGRIWVASTLGEGSTFGFALPLERAPEPVLEPRDEPGPPAVLVIEDDRRSAELLELYLDGSGLRVVLARDGAEGLELARSLRPRAVILDILLPRLDGWDLLGAPQGGPGDRGHPGRDRHDARRARQGARARGRRVPGQAGQPRGDDGGPGGRALSTVLIVEDNARNLKLVRDVLGHAGYETLEAPDAESGLALAREQRPDLVLMDINLPGMTGIEALARAARGRGDRRDPGRRADRVRDEGRPRADPRRRLRRLPREAGRRARAAGAGRGAAEAVILRRRRPAAERAAAARRARAARARGDRGRVGRGRASNASPTATSTSCCSTC